MRGKRGFEILDTGFLILPVLIRACIAPVGLGGDVHCDVSLLEERYNNVCDVAMVEQRILHNVVQQRKQSIKGCEFVEVVESECCVGMWRTLSELPIVQCI
ncbi:hypothetical protein EJ06DRAFT_525887 [Trichodelitschia bisporula]|uniref:Secreted protein n=1 Tax=Trichodelitschia bisporula TaxID=703511 RepID=A0A6G1IAN1_9PEZI|nr:hypothetical protein EJ06DRAFT_525887 [Trichodelitschia bisporula]